MADEFRGHLNALVTTTISLTPILPMYVHQTVDGERKEVVLLGFPRRSGRPGSIELRTKYGPVELYLGQVCDAVEDEGQRQLRLRTISYAYSLQPRAMDDRLVRWEYVRFPGEDAYWSQNHVQGPITIEIPDSANSVHHISLNDWHLPTGWVTIVDVIRFCLHDLEARSISEPHEWHEVLLASAERFRTEFEP